MGQADRLLPVRLAVRMSTVPCRWSVIFVTEIAENVLLVLCHVQISDVVLTPSHLHCKIQHKPSHAERWLNVFQFLAPPFLLQKNVFVIIGNVIELSIVHWNLLNNTRSPSPGSLFYSTVRFANYFIKIENKNFLLSYPNTAFIYNCDSVGTPHIVTCLHWCLNCIGHFESSGWN